MPISDGHICPRNDQGGSYEAYGYNSKTGRCESFLFKGCGGNSNRFPTAKECWTKCAKSSTTKCLKEAGLNIGGIGIFKRYYYDMDSHQCRSTRHFRKSTEDRNRFTTLQECEQECKDVPPPAMAAARRVVTDVLRGLEGKINTTDWMRGPAWCMMRTKFKAMYFIFGYPDGLGSEHLIETLFEEIPDVAENFTAGFLDAKRQATINVFRKNFKISMNTAAIGAHYHPDTHEVYLSATLLQPPIFIHGAPAAFNYAGIGMIAGHELSHAFDPEDIEYDVNGYIKKFPDTPMMKEFTAKVLCLRNSYYQAESEERGARSMNPTIDNEGVVDYTGVLLSYEAYKRLPEHEREARIPDMDFTPDQIFFITYCLKWCTESKSNKRGPGTLHWAARSRCLVPLRNMPEFSQAFGCKKGDRMNPDTKCPFY
ncbi:hypothetical protein V5799_007299 [Amblyomma americanum]|uniref:BPTI/Kunitz inhibitor domain-containing protein n=1 Tax=Amblyomma americanum TaxID=6943 RepID=A0AAQ4DTY2_AMBAM